MDGEALWAAAFEDVFTVVSLFFPEAARPARDGDGPGEGIFWTTLSCRYTNDSFVAKPRRVSPLAPNVLVVGDGDEVAPEASAACFHACLTATGAGTRSNFSLSERLGVYELAGREDASKSYAEGVRSINDSSNCKACLHCWQVKFIIAWFYVMDSRVG